MPERVKGFANERTKLVDELIAQLETSVTKAQDKAHRRMLNEFVDKLDVKDGRIQNTAKNRRLLNTVDAVFTQFQTSEGITMLNQVVTGVESILTFNKNYFEAIGEVRLIDLDKNIRSQMNDWLGIEKGGKLAKNGYLSKIITDTSIRNEVKTLAVKNIIAQSGFFETKKSIEGLIVGTEKRKLGILQKYYRNFVYDTYSTVDRLVGVQYANELGYVFAVYEGGLIKSSRQFCIERNGKVFHTTEIETFDPPVAKQPNYNPFTDLGGYACRHHLNWVSTKLAKYLGKDVEKFVNTGEK